MIMEAEVCTDGDLKRRVSNFLATRQHARLLRLDVDVNDGIVTLQGRLASFYEKQLALSCCQRVAGVRQLVDEVEVVA